VAFSVFVRVNRINQVQASITDRSKETVRDSARYMRDYAQAIAPVRTGAFRASLYVNGPDGKSDYPERAAAAAQANPRAHIIDEIKAADVDTGVGQLRNNLGQFSLDEAIVASAVEYSVFLEEGTRYMAPRPTLRPAAEATRQQFADAMSHVADDA
jgi:HK97 gp10 family phage protein